MTFLIFHGKTVRLDRWGMKVSSLIAFLSWFYFPRIIKIGKLLQDLFFLKGGQWTSALASINIVSVVQRKTVDVGDCCDDVITVTGCGGGGACGLSTSCWGLSIRWMSGSSREMTLLRENTHRPVVCNISLSGESIGGPSRPLYEGQKNILNDWK